MNFQQTKENAILLISKGELGKGLEVLADYFKPLPLDHDYSNFLSLSGEYASMNHAHIFGVLKLEDYFDRENALRGRIIQFIQSLEKLKKLDGISKSNPLSITISEESSQVAIVIHKLNTILALLKEKEQELEEKIEGIKNVSDPYKVDILEIEIEKIRADVTHYKNRFDDFFNEFRNLQQAILKHTFSSGVEEDMLKIISSQSIIKSHVEYLTISMEDLKKLVYDLNLRNIDLEQTIVENNKPNDQQNTKSITGTIVNLLTYNSSNRFLKVFIEGLINIIIIIGIFSIFTVFHLQKKLEEKENQINKLIENSSKTN